MKYLNKENYYNFFINFFAANFIFMSTFKFGNFQSRYLILILSIPAFLKMYEDLKLNKYNYFKFFFLIFFFVFLQISLNLYFEKASLTKYSLVGIIYFFFIFSIGFYFWDKIINNLTNIISIFYFIFFISVLISFFFYKPSADNFCGGIPNFFESFGLNKNMTGIVGHYDGSSLGAHAPPGNIGRRIYFKEFIFKENSHLGMIAPSIIIYFIYKLQSNKISRIYLYSSIFFIIIAFIKGSTTLLAGLSISSIVFLVFHYKKFYNKSKFFLIILFCFSVFTLFQSSECVSRFVPSYRGSHIISEDFTEKAKILLDSNNNLSIRYNNPKTLNDEASIGGSMSSAIYFHSIKVTIKSILDKPFGWGLNRYDVAFNYYNSLDPPELKELIGYNNKDGTNNLNKIIVEFGIFGIIFYLFVIRFFFSNKIDIEQKVFLLPLIITQSIRGAGYFNGGFSLIALLMIFSYINNRKNKHETVNNNTML